MKGYYKVINCILIYIRNGIMSVNCKNTLWKYLILFILLEFFRQESFKDKMYVRASVYCPFVAKLYDKIKK